MATRLMLSLLALLAGLTAQFVPAQVRGASKVSVEIVRDDARLVARRVALTRPLPEIENRSDDCTVLILKRAPDCQPPVFVGIDRARQ